jgi:D-arabinose 1-dehydrogenase-like Zn-dependent alcohol dehydrogenase
LAYYLSRHQAHWARPGQWLAVIGIGGLGHIAVQYGRAMGLRVVDVSTEKLHHAKRLFAQVMIDAREGDPGAALKEKTDGSAHGAIVTAVSARASNNPSPCSGPQARYLSSFFPLATPTRFACRSQG